MRGANVHKTIRLVAKHKEMKPSAIEKHFVRHHTACPKSVHAMYLALFAVTFVRNTSGSFSSSTRIKVFPTAQDCLIPHRTASYRTGLHRTAQDCLILQRTAKDCTGLPHTAQDCTGSIFETHNNPTSSTSLRLRLLTLWPKNNAFLRRADSLFGFWFLVFLLVFCLYLFLNLQPIVSGCVDVAPARSGGGKRKRWK
jgi:hypothetical protein